jgi:hypothetical protein
MLAIAQCERFASVGTKAHRVRDKPSALQRILEDLCDPNLVFDDQKAHVFALDAGRRGEGCLSVYVGRPFTSFDMASLRQF